jgi:hypothetical protein
VGEAAQERITRYIYLLQRAVGGEQGPAEGPR